MDIVAILQENWAVIEGAPLAAFLLVLLGAVAGYWLSGRIYAGSDGALRDRLAHKDERISELEKRLADGVSAPQVVPDEPDAIIQGERVVGKMIAPRLELGEGRVYANAIRGDENFNPDAVFRFRGRQLSVEKADARMESKGAFGRGTALSNVVCKVVET
ncbi:hypothetical protein SAMN04487859_13224 [Roseovarius lutimaris]|uniref:Uncharacterized protein n=1 Tax=Roseovarius lutimaris TaxID=1005928 RepID=A0A1I5GKT1_9RHOB|nr:hypothetical protein [Roseovarius lutimaris]SFO36595.1 hypothetical protein SAMN04487859_13224 [Roseovarius lutimaris]